MPQLPNPVAHLLTARVSQAPHWDRELLAAPPDWLVATPVPPLPAMVEPGHYLREQTPAASPQVHCSPGLFRQTELQQRPQVAPLSTQRDYSPLSAPLLALAARFACFRPVQQRKVEPRLPEC